MRMIRSASLCWFSPSLGQLAAPPFSLLSGIKLKIPRDFFFFALCIKLLSNIVVHKHHPIDQIIFIMFHGNSRQIREGRGCRNGWQWGSSHRFTGSSQTLCRISPAKHLVFIWPAKHHVIFQLANTFIYLVVHSITHKSVVTSIKNWFLKTQVFQIVFFNELPGLLQIAGVCLVLVSIISLGVRGIFAEKAREKNVAHN